MEGKVIKYTMDYGDSKIHVKFLDQSHLKIQEGDRVTIKAQGTKVTGTVTSASHYGREGWFVELNDADNGFGAAYWKQYLDGGYVTQINGKDVI